MRSNITDEFQVINYFDSSIVSLRWKLFSLNDNFDIEIFFPFKWFMLPKNDNIPNSLLHGDIGECFTHGYNCIKCIFNNSLLE